MATHTIKVTGVGEQLLELLDRRIREQHATGRAEYIRELIRRDVLGSAPPARSLRDILAPVHQETRERGYTEANVEEFTQEALSAHRQGRRAADAAERA